MAYDLGGHGQGHTSLHPSPWCPAASFRAQGAPPATGLGVGGLRFQVRDGEQDRHQGLNVGARQEVVGRVDGFPGGGLPSGGCQPPAAYLTVAGESSSLGMATAALRREVKLNS